MDEVAIGRMNELRSMIIDRQQLPVGIAGLRPDSMHHAAEDPRLIRLLTRLSGDCRGLLEAEGRQRGNQSYDAFIFIPYPGDDHDAHATLLLLHKTLPLLATASYGQVHQRGTPFESRWYGDFCDLSLNWSRLEDRGWLYIPKEVCNTELTKFDMADEAQPEIRQAGAYNARGLRTLGDLAFNLAG